MGGRKGGFRSGYEGCGTGNMLERRDTGMEGCRKRGKKERRVQVRRDAELDTGQMLERRDTGKEGLGQKVC